jgi:tetraacyldisaccharide 4'-kinase
VELQDLSTGKIIPLSALQGMRAGALSAIASPESFEQGLRRLGVNLELTQSYADHHRFSKRELERFIKRCSRRGVPFILTTEKDAVRMPRLLNQEVPVLYLRIEIEILKGHEEWDRMLAQLARPEAPIVDDSETTAEATRLENSGSLNL